MHASLGFFGAEGPTDVNVQEVDMKAVMARVCGRVVAVVDHTKLGQVGLAPFVRISGLSRVIIDRGVETEVVDQLRGAGVEVQLV